MAIHYVCNSCSKRIFPVSARFHCLLCPDYDACQACHLAARYTPPHEGSHPFHVVYDPTTSPPPTAALSALTLSQPPPPPPPPPLPFRSPPNPPPLPPRQLSSTSSTPQSPHSPNSPSAWGPLLTPQHTPTPHLHRLADAAFHHFSTQGPAQPQPQPQPTMTPEQLARFYTAMGRSGSTNFPDLFHTLMARYGATLDPSDAQIAFVFQEYAYPFVLATRPGSAVPGAMPLLLLDGFRRMLVDEILEAPEEAWRGFNTLLAAVAELGLAAAGPIPRACFPEREDRAARARGDRISVVLVERSRAMFERLERERGEQGKEALAATRARIEMEQRGMDNCLGGWRRDEWGNEYYDEGLI